MTTEQQGPSPENERLAALIDLAREHDEQADFDYPELVVLLEAEARRQHSKHRRRP